MEPDKFFRTMYFDIWQSNNIEKIDQYYSTNFIETIDTTTNNTPITLKLDYQDLIKNAYFQKNNYINTTFELKKLIASDQYISVNFYSSSVYKLTHELRHRYVCGIWHLDKNNKIDRVWAVITPHYQDIET